MITDYLYDPLKTYCIVYTCNTCKKTICLNDPADVVNLVDCRHEDAVQFVLGCKTGLFY